MNDAQRSVERIHQLSDMLQSLMQQAAVLQQKADASMVQSRQASDALKRASDRLPLTVGTAIETVLEPAAEKAAAKMTATWAQANAAAAEATRTFAAAQETLQWKMLAYACTGALAVVVLIAAAMAYLSPTERELKELRAERQMLLADMDRLRKAGAGLEVAQCTHQGRPRTCVRVDAQSPRFEGGYLLVPAR
ncbi:hypothetical protein AVMA1855_03060 [Acidovorax sp. SUPP1855]|uniref:hypothetical protein n=1 Tax=Acidovorax sp. SUPP1855 TaxID=431774 RepID=UPI0023DE20BB|nr:hypothetical protein [Acidovorax sp. SUPP1855]GKS83086.1 hypothetical protein AVMA1855_03060 [Acidovorax sp. SUPP1855]